MPMFFARFLGENRAIESKQLPEGHCTVSRNQNPGRGDLRPWRNPLEVMRVPGAPQRQTIYRMGRDTASDALYWLSWPAVVHAVRGFDVEDPSERTYYTGDGAPKVTDNLALTAGNPALNPVTHRPLGVPAPAQAPTVTLGPAPPESEEDDVEPQAFFYVYTFVTDWGWESSNSPVSAMVERRVDQLAYLASFSSAPAGNYNINRIRVYRTQAGSSGEATFFFMQEVALGTATVTDDGRDLGEMLTTSGWLTAPGVPRGGATNHTEPPLHGLTPMWNGMLAAITGKSVRVCEPYLPYAWPIENDVVPPDTPVALGVFGQSMVVLTTGKPRLVTGSSPDALEDPVLEMPQGCISARSVVSMGTGVAWASNDGLCWFGAGGGRLLTAGLMLRKDWLALRPETIIGTMYEGLYFGSYEPAPGEARKGFLIDPSGGSAIFFQDQGFDAAYFDELQDQLYLLRGVAIVKWDAGAILGTTRARGPLQRHSLPVNYGAAEVVATGYPVELDVYADGVLRFSKTVTSREAFRLPGGFLASDWQLEVRTAFDDPDAGVQAAILAATMQELGKL